eukprot:g1823.t1
MINGTRTMSCDETEKEEWEKEIVPLFRRAFEDFHTYIENAKLHSNAMQQHSNRDDESSNVNAKDGMTERKKEEENARSFITRSRSDLQNAFMVLETIFEMFLIIDEERKVVRNSFATGQNSLMMVQNKDPTELVTKEQLNHVLLCSKMVSDKLCLCGEGLLSASFGLKSRNGFENDFQNGEKEKDLTFLQFALQEFLAKILHESVCLALTIEGEFQRCESMTRITNAMESLDRSELTKAYKHAKQIHSYIENGFPFNKSLMSQEEKGSEAVTSHDIITNYLKDLIVTFPLRNIRSEQRLLNKANEKLISFAIAEKELDRVFSLLATVERNANSFHTSNDRDEDDDSGESRQTTTKTKGPAVATHYDIYPEIVHAMRIAEACYGEIDLSQSKSKSESHIDSSESDGDGNAATAGAALSRFENLKKIASTMQSYRNRAHHLIDTVDQEGIDILMQDMESQVPTKKSRIALIETRREIHNSLRHHDSTTVVVGSSPKIMILPLPDHGPPHLTHNDNPSRDNMVVSPFRLSNFSGLRSREVFATNLGIFDPELERTMLWWTSHPIMQPLSSDMKLIKALHQNISSPPSLYNDTGIAQNVSASNNISSAHNVSSSHHNVSPYHANFPLSPSLLHRNGERIGMMSTTIKGMMLHEKINDGDMLRGQNGKQLSYNRNNNTGINREMKGSNDSILSNVSSSPYYRYGGLVSSSALDLPQVHIISTNIHKLILGFCGDRKYSYPETMARELQYLGMQLGQPFSDEIFLQIMKQIRGNPWETKRSEQADVYREVRLGQQNEEGNGQNEGNEQNEQYDRNTQQQHRTEGNEEVLPVDSSLNLAWCLMFICLHAFGPSDELENYLEYFIRSHGNPGFSVMNDESPLLQQQISKGEYDDERGRIPSTSEDMLDILKNTFEHDRYGGCSCLWNFHLSGLRSRSGTVPRQSSLISIEQINIVRHCLFIPMGS